MLLNCGAGEDSWESHGLQIDQPSQSQRKSVLNTHWKDWYWSWSSNTLATWCEELTHWKRLWDWERLRTEGEEGIRGRDDWMDINLGKLREMVRNTEAWHALSPWGHKELDTTWWLNNNIYSYGFQGASVVKESACQLGRSRRLRLDPLVRKIPWRRKWQPRPIF